MSAQAIDPAAVKYVAQVSPVREVAVLGTADLDYWREPLARAELCPHDEGGRVPLMIGATDTRFMGVRFRELTVTVFCRDRRGTLPDGVFLAQAFNSVRWFAWVERNIFSTPYDHGVAEVTIEPAASFQLTIGGAVTLRATMSADPASQRATTHSASDGFAGPVYLPARKPGARLSWFYADIVGETDTFPFDPAHDSLSLHPTAGQPLIQSLVDSRFTASQWAVRSSATHKKSKSYRRSA
jgi:hypothetical protein